MSNAVSLFARPHLHRFLDWVIGHFDRVVLYTAVEGRQGGSDRAAPARRSVERLASLGDAPPWFATVEIVIQDGPCKDLRRVVPSLERVLLVDDMERAVCADQRSLWVPVAPWLPPYPSDDVGLIDARSRLAEVNAEP